MKISELKVEDRTDTPTSSIPHDEMCDPCAYVPQEARERKLLGPAYQHVGACLYPVKPCSCGLIENKIVVVEGDDGRGRYCRLTKRADGHLGAVELI